MQDFAGPSTECSKIWSWKKSARCSTIHAVWCQKIYTLDCYSPGNFIRITISHSKVAWKNSPDHCMILDDFGTFWYSTYWIFLSAFQRVTGPSPEASAHLVQFAPAVTCWINTLGDEPELVMSGSSTHRIHVCYIYMVTFYHQYTPVMLAYIPAPWIRHGVLDCAEISWKVLFGGITRMNEGN